MNDRLVAVLGGGQLGRMLGLAGIPLGMRFRFLDPSEDCPAAAVGEVIRAGLDDTAAIERLIDGADVVTFEFENVPVATAALIADRAALAPSAQSLAISQDRISEKDFFQSCDVPCQPYMAVASDAELAEAVVAIGTPAMLKTRRFGYDGKGQARVRSPEMAGVAWESLDRVPCIYEAFVPFEREVSLVASRSRMGSFVAHPIVTNEHRDGILAVTLAPDPAATPAIAAEAERHTRTIAERLGHVGTIAVEFFVSGGKLIANEMAPRVHNSAHWTIEGAHTSQFANHLRAISGLPLGDAGARGAAAMLNLIGAEPELEELLRIPGASVHRYGKAPRPGRKLGHVTIVARDHDELEPALERARQITR